MIISSWENRYYVHWKDAKYIDSSYLFIKLIIKILSVIVGLGSVISSSTHFIDVETGW
jgi:hypothetical protein